MSMDYKDFLITDKRLERPLDVEFLKGDTQKAKKILGWTAQTDFQTLVEIMVTEDLTKWKKWLKGERFPWDAPSYPNEKGILSRKIKFDR